MTSSPGGVGWIIDHRSFSRDALTAEKLAELVRIGLVSPIDAASELARRKAASSRSDDDSAGPF